VVIVADFDIKGVAVAEAKAQTPLTIDPDRVLADAVACQGYTLQSAAPLPRA
jgi:hypothetical protein